MEQINRIKSHTKPYTIGGKRSLVSRTVVILNVCITLFIHIAKYSIYTVEASSISSNSHKPPTADTSAFGHQLHRLRSSDSEEFSDDLKVANNLETNALIYLQRYGYMQAHSNTGANNLISEDSFSNAISSFQKFAGIPETGTVNEQTWLYMQMPRCGNKDKQQFGGDSTQSTRIQKHGAGVRKRRRRKRYALQGSKWRRQELTYRISQYPTRFNGKRHEVDSQIEKAFGIWSQVAPIDFIVKKEGRVHIDIRFASGDHGDGDAFDGPGNTLAHAYFPQYGGDAHFDDQEYWTIDSYAGTNIFQVAAHELGHSLGLGHSNVREALMAPFYQKYKPNFKLHVDDILAIQALYGEKPFLLDSSSSSPAFTPPTTMLTSTTNAPTTTTTIQPTVVSINKTQSSTLPPPTTARFPFFVNKNNRGKPGPKQPPFDGRETNEGENGQPEVVPGVGLGGNGIGGAEADGVGGSGSNHPHTGHSYPADLCSDSSIDAITRTEDGSSYVFKGDYYWLLTHDGLAKGYPRQITTDWDKLPGSLDAALTWADGKTFFFKGNKYWRYRNKRRDVGYPKLISAGFAGIPDDIDAAFVWSGNGRTYIFKGTEYWRFDSKADPPVSSEYPRSIKVWNGVPAHVNAAFRWENNVTYFFKGSQYYRFNDKEFKVEARGQPPFPRPSAEWWFGCVSSNLAQRALPGISSLSSLEGRSTEKSQDIDWSYYAGLKDDNNRIMGTHISDHKPPAPDNNNETNRRSNEPHLDYEQITNLHNNPRISFSHHSVAKSTVSSSAISSLQCNLVVILRITLLATLTTTLNYLIRLR